MITRTLAVVLRGRRERREYTPLQGQNLGLGRGVAALVLSRSDCPGSHGKRARGGFSLGRCPPCADSRGWTGWWGGWGEAEPAIGRASAPARIPARRSLRVVRLSAVRSRPCPCDESARCGRCGSVQSWHFAITSTQTAPAIVDWAGMLIRPVAGCAECAPWVHMASMCPHPLQILHSASGVLLYLERRPRHLRT